MSLIPKNWNRYSTEKKWGLLASFAGVVGFLILIYQYLFPPVSTPSITELIAKDSNPTKLEVTDVKIKTWLGDSEPFITVSVRNVSQRTAIDVKPAFQDVKSRWYFTPTKSSNFFQNGLSIEPQSTTEFPVAPVSEFISKISKDCANCYLLGIGKDANIPINYVSEVCQNTNPCGFPSRSQPFRLSLHYKNIFNEQVHQDVYLFSYFSISKPLNR